ncbi:MULTISPECIES: S1C family serine protease [Clostridium]|jgi:S1-C subfamily serine protease|uniref:S1C family serine protease n=1 Tax=Clostridium lapidicellarium TaxID=3240931 RepID=A0ABV4DXS2_9CLOT|nr:trypsin-like peptidase domain-containing protein [uncultured Clostridium sp.]
MKINKISVIISAILISASTAACFTIHKNMRSKPSENLSKLGNITEVTSTSKTRDLNSIIHENQKSVVSLEVKNGSKSTTGSGFIYDKKGDIVTNAHLIKDRLPIIIRMADTKTYRGKLLGKSEITDIALVRVDALKGKNPMKISRDKKADIGDEIIALGSPLGPQNTADIGIISGSNINFSLENYQYKNVYQISVPVSSGNSGGPLLDKNTGQVIGIISTKADNKSVGFSIPINQVTPMLDSWSSNTNTTEFSTQNRDSYENPKPSTKNAVYLVSYFYSSLNSKDYVTAYSLLGSGWQGKIPYENFRKSYLQTISVKTDNMLCHQMENGSIEVSASIEALEGNETNSGTNTYNVIYTIGYENNSLKILSGKITPAKQQ